jgi:hypothetical protein
MAPLLDLNQVNPSHVFVLLFLLVGGSMVHRALAQNVGPRFAPVAFSFGTSPRSILRRCNANYLAGWIPFSLSALCSNDVMPAPDFACKVINASNGYVHENCNWILSRLVRDFETYWMSDETKTVLGDMLQEKWEYAKERAILACEDKREIAKPKQAGLYVSVYTALAPPPRSFLHFDWTSIFVIGVQFALSTVPYITSGNPSVFTITLAGTLLALSTSCLPALVLPSLVFSKQVLSYQHA